MSRRHLVAILILFPLAALADQQPKSAQPFIDQIKESMESEGSPAANDVVNPSAQPYIDRLKSRDEDAYDRSDAEDPSKGYTDRWKARHPEQAKPEQEGSYTDRIKSELEGFDEDRGGAIQAVNEGRSELKANFGNKPIHNAAGFRIGVASSRSVKLDGSTNTFESIYGNSWVPDLNFFYEYQPWHSETWGSLGILGSFGASYHHGKGLFSTTLTNPSTGASFGQSSQTSLQFFTIPVTVAGCYRMNLTRLLRPYFWAGPSLIGYYESRSDDKGGHRGYSKGFSYALGANISLNWLAPKTSWEVYQSSGAKHYFLTVEYSRLATLAGDVKFSSNVLTTGFTFEF